ncbi:MAG: glycoside hydrolase family 130 protein [Candidatus Dormibacteraeota bacterium]|nr:glycoside hydrolase family 130 protein [Candidatus Dormibacteraeota bacterium]
MSDLARRFPGNPIVSPQDVRPSRPGLSVIGVLNPASFRFQGKSWLLLRVAEGVPAGGDQVSASVLDPATPGGMRTVAVRRGDPLLAAGSDPRAFVWSGDSYLTTISHFRLASSADGVHFQVEAEPALEGEGELESYGIEDGRVAEIDGSFWLAYTAVSPSGFGVSLASTVDWKTFDRHGMIFAPPNKDCVLFPEKIGGSYLALHRPVSQGLGGQYIWLASSPDLLHWGDHRCVVRPRRGAWDSAKVGAGAPPVRTEEGWLEIYHGVDDNNRYCLGAVLLDLNDPAHVLGRSSEAIMEPLTDYERGGFYGNVVFATGAMATGDEFTLYYGAADEWVCGATMSIREILASLD